MPCMGPSVHEPDVAAAQKEILTMLSTRYNLFDTPHPFARPDLRDKAIEQLYQAIRHMFEVDCWESF